MNKKMKLFVIFCLLISVFTFPINSNAKEKSGTASVWAGMPLIGHVYIRTPYRVTYYGTGDQKYIYQITTGKSYTSAGVSVMSYSHYRTWGTKYDKTSYCINAQGHCDLMYKGCPISMGLQTFAWYGKV